MSSVTYGGRPGRNDGIKMDLVKTRVLSNQPMHDSRSTYMYTQVRTEYQCVLNPEQNAFLANNAGVVQLALGQGVQGPTTVAAVRHMLAQPRRQLIVVLGNTEVLRTPADGAASDVGNGPIVVEPVSVTEVIGGKTLHVRFVVQSHINECRGNRDAFGNTFVSPLLSHTWTMIEDLDDQGFSTRTVEGRAVFRADRLEAIGARPDDFRAWLFHPVPDNTQRTGVKVLATDDGLQVAYTFTDVEQYCRILHDGITSIEGHHIVSVYRPGVAGTMMSEVTRAYRGIVTARNQAQDRRSRARTDGGNPNSARGAAADITGVIFDAVLAMAPKVTVEVQVVVTGFSSTPHSVLSPIAHRVAASRLTSLSAFLYNARVAETRHLNEPVVEVNTVFERGFGVDPWTAANILREGITQPIISQWFPAGGVTVDPSIRDVMTMATGPGKVYPGGKTSRGFLSAAIVAQALTEACGTRVQPTNPGPAGVRGL